MVGVLLGLVLPACGTKVYLMPTPAIYTNPEWNPFADVPPALQSDLVSVLYVTDRAPVPPEDEGDPNDAITEYGSRRSRSAAFGRADVRLGRDLTWDQIVQASRTQHRPAKIELTLESAQEIARFGPTPPTLILTDEQLAAGGDPPPDASHLEAERRFLEELSVRLALSPRKDVYIYIHGFAYDFEHAALTTAEIWHFLGREGVPICYSWPASSGLFRAYSYTLASTEFTIYHLKQTLRLIASCPDVHRVHILAHSRGTEVTLNAIRELHLELRSTTDTQKALKLGTVILAAADIDIDVMIGRNSTERLILAVERLAVYVSSRDEALGFSSWIFGGTQRLGSVSLHPELFTQDELAVLRTLQRGQLIDADVRHAGGFGHDYYRASPAVSSDVIMVMRFGLGPGAQNARPLEISDTGLWRIDDDYPGTGWTPPALFSPAPSP